MIRQKYDAVFGVQIKDAPNPEDADAPEKEIIKIVEKEISKPIDPAGIHPGDNPPSKTGGTTKRGAAKKKSAKKPQ